MRFFEHPEEYEPGFEPAQPGLEGYLKCVAGRKGIMGRGGRERKLALLTRAPDTQAVAGGGNPRPVSYSTQRMAPAAAAPATTQASARSTASQPSPDKRQLPAFRPSPEMQRQPRGSGVIGELNRGYREMMPVEPFIEHAHRIGVPENKQWDTETRVLFAGRDGGAYSRDINPFVEGESPYGKRPSPRPAAQPTSPAPAETAGTEPWRARLPDMIGITLQNESRNRDLDDTGRVITSRRGAQGRMQVMPRTNRNPGYGVTPAQDDSLEERARVGRDYLAALMARYDGDPERAWAAYNLGPVALNRLMRRYGDRWRDHLPAETRDYIGANTQALESLERERSRR